MRREYPLQPIVGVGAVIVQEGKLVLIKRGVDPEKGKWSIPGGGVEIGEPVRDTAVREAKEECGLDIELVNTLPMDVMDKIVLVEDGRLKYHYVMLQFLAQKKGGTLRPSSDAEEARWVSLDKVEKFDLTNSFRIFFRKHRKKLESA